VGGWLGLVGFAAPMPPARSTIWPHAFTCITIPGVLNPSCACAALLAAPQLHHDGTAAASDMQREVEEAVVSAERGAAAHGNLM